MTNTYLVSHNLRLQAWDELILDIDDRTEHGIRCISAIGTSLYRAGYWFSLWYAVGMKTPHIHISHIFNLRALTKEENRAYRRAFYARYIPVEFHQPLLESGVRGAIPDYSLCDPYQDGFHPVPIEGAPHHKYKTPYICVAEFNYLVQQPDGTIGPVSWNFTEPDLYNEAVGFPWTEGEHPLNPASKKNRPLFTGTRQYLFQKIAARISISHIADAFGLEPLGKASRVCCFHADSAPSLSLSDEKGVYHCFGCKASGTIIDFYARLKALRPDFRYTGGQQ